jgi:hypothetical protein
MPNPQLEQFMHALAWRAVPVIVLAGGGAIVLRELLRRIGRRTARTVRATRTDRGRPLCPSCNRKMVKRTVRRGARAGAEFWGCSGYPGCSDTRGI